MKKIFFSFFLLGTISNAWTDELKWFEQVRLLHSENIEEVTKVKQMLANDKTLVFKIQQSLKRKEHIEESIEAFTVLSLNDLCGDISSFSLTELNGYAAFHFLSKSSCREKESFEKNMIKILEERWDKIEAVSKLLFLDALWEAKVEMGPKFLMKVLNEGSDQGKYAALRLAVKYFELNSSPDYIQVIKVASTRSPYQLRLEVFQAIANMNKDKKMKFISEIKTGINDQNEDVKNLCKKILTEIEK